MVGTFVQLIDPDVDGMDFYDKNIYQFKCTVEGYDYFALLKYQPVDLIRQLNRLSQMYELVIFTILPR